MAVYLLAINGEEVVFQDLRDAQQQVGVDAPASEDGVDVSALATQFACKPTDAPLLAAQFCLDEVPDVYHPMLFCFPGMVGGWLSDTKKDVGVSTFAHPTRRLSHCLRFRISNAVGPRHCILRNSPVCFWLSGRGHNTPGMDVPLPYLQKRFQICEICALKTTFVNVLFAMGNLCNVCKSADAASPFLNHKSTHPYHAGRLSREQM